MAADAGVRDAEQTLRSAYRAFNDRELDAAVELMHPEVDWPNAWEGGRLRGRAEVLAYWRRQFAEIDPRVTPERFAERDDGRIAVDVHQVVRSLDGELLADRRVVHVYALRDGRVERMDVEDG
jgi:ketosteroid isomerase-like protein